MAAVIQQQHPPQQHHGHVSQSQMNQILPPHIPPVLPVPRATTNVVPPPPSAPTPAPQNAGPAPPSHPPTPAIPQAPSQPQPQPAASSSKTTTHEGRGVEREPTTGSRSSSSTSERKRSRVLMEETSMAPADDRDEWYYPAAPRPQAAIDSDEEQDLDPGAPTGNWGNKLVKGARWVRKGKLTPWGPGKAEWEMENHARKRLRSLLPDQSTPDSPPLPTLPHLRSPTPPLVTPYALPPKAHTSYTSLLVDPSVQHTYTNTTVSSLQRTATEFIETEGALRIALGALWQAMSIDNGTPPAVSGGAGDASASSQTMQSRHQSVDGGESLKHGTDMVVDAAAVNGDQRMSSPSSVSGVPVKSPGEVLVASLSPSRQLFISPTPVTVGQEGAPAATLPSASQLESYEWAVGVIRDLGDDTREYMERLNEVRELSGHAGAVRKEVWRVIKEKSLEEMDEEAEQEDDEGGEEGSEY